MVDPTMSIKDILTLIGGIMACVGPILMMSHNDDMRTIGLAINSVAGLLLGTRGLNQRQPQEVNNYYPEPEKPAINDAQYIDRTALEKVIIQRIERANEYPEQNLAPKLYDSKDEREKAFQEWRSKANQLNP